VVQSQVVVQKVPGTERVLPIRDQPWASSRGPVTEVLPKPPVVRSYIYSRDEVRQLLDAIHHLTITAT